MQKRRSEVVERTFAHICDTGGGRRTWLRGMANVSKRYLMAAAAHNLGRILLKLTGTGKPKAFQPEGGLAALAQSLQSRAGRGWATLARVFADTVRRLRPDGRCEWVAFAGTE